MPKLAVVLYLVLTAAAASAHRSLQHRPGDIPIDWRSVPPSTYEILYNHETLLTIPEGPPKGVIFVLASCDTFVLVWGFPSHGCKRCVGKPEEMLIVYHAIKRGYVVFVIGPLLSGTDDLCFQRIWPPEDSWETAELRRTMRLVLEEHGWWQLPRFLLGTSAGGSEAMILATRFPVQAVASMLMGIQPDGMLEEAHLLCHNPDVAEESNVTWAYPPVLLLKASEDHDMMKERIDNTRKFFRRHDVHVELIVMEPYPFQPHTFGHILPYVDSEQSAALFQDLRAASLIDGQGFGQLPHSMSNRTQWFAARETMEGILISHFGREAARPREAVERHLNALWKMFYAAQAIHETRGRETKEILNFFERQAVPDKERIADMESDLVRQGSSNADAVADVLGVLPGRLNSCLHTSQHAATGRH